MGTNLVGVARLLVVVPHETDPPARLGDWLREAGCELDERHQGLGEPLPETLDGYDGMVVLGGPQSALDDEATSPELVPVRELLRQALAADFPTLAICLGAQLLAEATGGRVAKGEQGVEAGARLVAKRDAAWEDELFRDVPLTPTVVQWHEDAIVDLPPGAVNLASSPRYAHQAFRLGDRAWGLQFHIETPPEMVRHWGAEYGRAVEEAGLDPVALAESVVEELPEVEACWRPAVERFAALAAGRGRVTLPLVESE